MVRWVDTSVNKVAVHEPHVYPQRHDLNRVDRRSCFGVLASPRRLGGNATPQNT